METAIERVHTGIPGLDHVLEGGFPKGARVLLAGGAGCGKTICCGQYLYKGATKFGEPGVYVSTEEPPSEFKANMLRFGWDFKKLENEKKIGMVDAVYQRVESEVTEQESLQSILFNLRSKLSEVKILVEQLVASRLVVDSLPGFAFRITDLNALRGIFLEVGLLLKEEERAEAAGNTSSEEVVTGNIPVSQGEGVVEQGVQVEQSAPDQAGYQQGYQDQYPNRQDQQRRYQA